MLFPCEMDKLVKYQKFPFTNFNRLCYNLFVNIPKSTRRRYNYFWTIFVENTRLPLNRHSSNNNMTLQKMQEFSLKTQFIMKETVKGTAMAAASIAKHRDNKLMAWK